MFSKDIAMGTTDITKYADYGTWGPRSSLTNQSEAPVSPPPECYVWLPAETCTKEQLAALLDGTAIVHDYIVVSNYTSIDQRPSMQGSVKGGPRSSIDQ